MIFSIGIHLSFILPWGIPGVLLLLAFLIIAARKVCVHTELFIFAVVLHLLLFYFDWNISSRDAHPPSQRFGLVEIKINNSQNLELDPSLSAPELEYVDQGSWSATNHWCIMETDINFQ
jgi:hypothetical protein